MKIIFKIILSKDCFQNVVLFAIFAIVFSKLIQICKGFIKFKVDQIINKEEHISQTNKVLPCILKIWEWNFLIMYSMILKNMERINKRYRNKVNIIQCWKCLYIIICVPYSHEIKFMQFKFQRYKSIGIFLLLVKRFMITNNSVMGIQNLVVNHA